MGTGSTAGAFLTLLVMAGCAGNDTPPASDVGTDVMDSGVVVDSSVPEDSSPDVRPPDPPPDTGPPPPACEDDDYGDTCEAATDLGMLLEGETMSPPPGSLPDAGDEDWYRIDFPANPDMNTPGGGTPTIEITVNEGDAFRFEVLDTCTTILSCPEDAMATGIDSWSFVDDQAMEGDEQWSTRDVPWPQSVLIRVYRPDGAPDCQRYRLGISR